MSVNGSDIIVVTGGVIPPQDYDELLQSGCAAIFGPGWWRPSQVDGLFVGVFFFMMLCYVQKIYISGLGIGYFFYLPSQA